MTAGLSETVRITHFISPLIFVYFYLFLAACLACGNFITCFPDECSPYLNDLFSLFLANLEDSIPSVRQGAAVALASVVKAYGEMSNDSFCDNSAFS